MPNYEYENTETGERHYNFSSYEESKVYLEENPQLRRVIGAPNFVGSIGSSVKVDDGFKEVLSKVKDTYTINNIKDY